MARKKQKRDDGAIAVNRKARYDYEIVETLEAGLVLTGTEVKSLRAGRASLAEAYATVRDGEAWLVQAHIPEYEFGNRANHDPTRMRKLLVHRRQLADMAKFTQEQGRTLVPLKLYWNADGRAKILLGFAEGKAQHDKRKSVAKRDAQREIERALRNRQRA